jgi:hypothetical protein
VTVRNKLAAACIMVPAVIQFVFGVIYLREPEIMPYHKEVHGVDWAQLQLQPGVRTMLVAFIHVYGAMLVAVAVALGCLTLFALRSGQRWARWTILAVGLPAFGSAVLTAVRLAFTTGAHTPWHLALVLFALFLIGVALAELETGRLIHSGKR